MSEALVRLARSLALFVLSTTWGFIVVFFLVEGVGTSPEYRLEGSFSLLAVFLVYLVIGSAVGYLLALLLVRPPLSVLSPTGEIGLPAGVAVVLSILLGARVLGWLGDTLMRAGIVGRPLLIVATALPALIIAAAVFLLFTALVRRRTRTQNVA